MINNEDNISQDDELSHALNYIKKVKKRFQQNHNDIYKTFIEILCKFQNEQSNLDNPNDLISLKFDVFVKISKLFADHHDLLYEFYDFLPSETDSSSSSNESVNNDDDQNHEDEDNRILTTEFNNTLTVPIFKKGKIIN